MIVDGLPNKWCYYNFCYAIVLFVAMVLNLDVGNSLLFWSATRLDILIH